MSLARTLATWLGLRADDAATSSAAVPAGVRPPSRTATGVSVERAVGLSAVYRALFIWATGASQLTLDVRRGLQQVVPQPAIVRQPDLTTSRSAFIEESTMSLAAHGNAYWLLHRKGNDADPTAEVRTAEVLDPNLVTPLPNQDNTRIAGYSYQGRTLHLPQVQHLQLLRVPGRLTGLGPIQAARAEIEGALDVQDYSTGWFRRGDVPPGILTTDTMIGPELAKQYKAAWYEDTEGIKILGSGLKFDPILLSPKDAQWIESQNLSVLQVARMFGIPARIMLASLDGSSETYANLQQEDLSFVRWTLIKALREIEEAFTALVPRGNEVRFNLDGILRADTTTRYQAYGAAISAGFMTIDEVRATEGMPPIGTADTTTGDPE